MLAAYPISPEGSPMPGTSAVCVSLVMVVTAKLEAENATEAELFELVRRDPESVRGAMVARIEQPGMIGEKEAGALDESGDRMAFVTDVMDVEAVDIGVSYAAAAGLDLGPTVVR